MDLKLKYFTTAFIGMFTNTHLLFLGQHRQLSIWNFHAFVMQGCKFKSLGMKSDFSMCSPNFFPVLLFLCSFYFFLSFLFLKSVFDRLTWFKRIFFLFYFPGVWPFSMVYAIVNQYKNTLESEFNLSLLPEVLLLGGLSTDCWLHASGCSLPACLLFPTLSFFANESSQWNESSKNEFYSRFPVWPSISIQQASGLKK